MDSQVNLSHLSEEECQQILAVIQRDFNLRQQEKDRLEELKAEIKEEKLRSEIVSKGHAFNENCCVRCFSQFYIFFNPKVQCISCKYNVCKKCSVYDNKQKKYMCIMCKKQEELDTLSNSWFYSNVAERFDRFGSADVVRSIHKRKTESDGDSDSGYHPPLNSTSEPNGKLRTSSPIRTPVEKPSTTGVDKEKPILAHLQQRLDVIEKNVKLHLEENKTEQKQFYDNSVKQNIDSVQALLMTVARQLAASLNSVDSDDGSCERVNCEQQETISKRLLQNAIHQLYSSPSTMDSNNGDPFALIDPAVLTLDAYTKRLSEAFINKINEDLHQSERQIEEEEEEVVNKRMHGGAVPQLSDSELLTTDSMSDVDFRDRISLWRQRSVDMNLSRSESQSLTSLNQSQTDLEMPSCFIESQVLTEKLATLDQSHAISQSSMVTQVNSVISNQSDLGTRLASTSSQSDAETRTSETLSQSKIETMEAVTFCVEQSEVDSVLNNNATHKKFDSSEYEVTTDCILAFAMRKRETPLLPSLDSEEGVVSLKSSDSDLHLTRAHEADEFCGPWILGINRRIPMTPHGSFRSNRSSDRSRSDCPSIFLPKHLHVEAPLIGDISASELSDTDSLSLTDHGSEADEDEMKPSESYTQTDKNAPTRHRTRSIGQSDDSRSKLKQLSIDSSAQTDDVILDEKFSAENETSKAKLDNSAPFGKDLPRDSCLLADGKSAKTDEASQADCATDSSSFDLPDSAGLDVEPRFKETPQNVVVSSGQSFKCRATLSGRRPIDVFWFHDTFRLDYDERCTVAHKGRVHSLEVVESTAADGGHYVCIAVSEQGRCSHRFTVSIKDTENHQMAGTDKGFKVLATTKRVKPTATSQHLSKAKPQIAASTVVTSSDAISHNITSSVDLSLNMIPHSDISITDRSSDTKPETSVAAAAKMLAHDIVKPDNSSYAVASAAESPCEVPLDATSHISRRKLLESMPVMQSKLTTPTHDRTLDSAAEDAKLTLQVLSQPPLQVSEEQASLHLDHLSAATPYQSESTTKTGLFQSVCKDADASDGKVELKLSYPDFERLYNSHIMTPNQLKSGRFTPEEIRRILEFLGKHREIEDVAQVDNQQRDDEKLAAFEEVRYKAEGLKAQLYGRDYVIKHSGQHALKTAPSRRMFPTSSVSSSPQISDNELEFHSTAKSDVMRKDMSRLQSSSRMDHPESLTLSHRLESSSAPKGQLDSSSARHQLEPSGASFSNIAKSTKHLSNAAKDKAGRRRPEKDGSMTKTVTGVEELSLPSVRSLRQLFNASPVSGDEIAFTRNYSLTARDLPNSVIAQQHLAKKARTSRLSLVSEPSASEDRQMHSESYSSSREDN